MTDAGSDLASERFDKIVQAAAAEFAENGFDGTGMKALALRAGVSQSLLHYHFGSKDKLYHEVIRKQSQLINEDRLARLHAIDLSESSALEQIFDALFEPALGPAGAGRTYARIFAGMITGSERDQALVRECYDPTAHQFLDAIEKVLDGADRAVAAYVFQFALGVLASMIGGDGRAARLLGIEGTMPDEDALRRQVTKFVAGGARAIASIK